MFATAIKCVGRGFRAIWHGYWTQMQEWGYIMAMGYLPQDETEDMIDPDLSEYQKRHPAA